MTATDLVGSRISIPADAVRDFCVRNHVRRLALFGSVLRDDFTDHSDVDLLIEYEPGKTPGLAFFGTNASCPSCWAARWTSTPHDSSVATTKTTSGERLCRSMSRHDPSSP